MKPTVKPATNQPALHRRKLLGAAGTTGALVAAAGLLATRQDAADAPVGATLQTEPEQKSGYRLTAHVQRYYQTTKV
jgi:hypothetical protein